PDRSAMVKAFRRNSRRIVAQAFRRDARLSARGGAVLQAGQLDLRPRGKTSLRRRRTVALKTEIERSTDTARRRQRRSQLVWLVEPIFEEDAIEACFSTTRFFR